MSKSVFHFEPINFTEQKSPTVIDFKLLNHCLWNNIFLMITDLTQLHPLFPHEENWRIKQKLSDLYYSYSYWSISDCKVCFRHYKLRQRMTAETHIDNGQCPAIWKRQKVFKLTYRIELYKINIISLHFCLYISSLCLCRYNY